jgi:hypothetical protein
MPTLEPRHLAAWKRAADHTKPSVDHAPPSYGANVRPARRRVVKVEAVETAEELPVELLANE